MKRSASLQSGVILPRIFRVVAPLLMLGTMLPASAGQTDVWSLPLSVAYGKASWYGAELQGRLTANGERSHTQELTAAHRHAPLGTYAIVTNLRNGHAVRVRINDRGPFTHGRILDLSYHAARILDMVGQGVAHVKVEFLSDTTRTAPTYTIQTGVQHDLSGAAALQKRLAAHYPCVWTALDAGSQQPFYRVRLGLFWRLNDAEQAVQQLSLQGYPVTVAALH